MGRVAFVFSGQGAQQVGMGRSFYEQDHDVRTFFDQAEQVRPGTLSLMFEGSNEELKKTEHTQPCLYLTDLAAAMVLEKAGITPDGVAGFSLGELPALAFAGAYDALTGFQLTTLRGRFMSEVSEKSPSTMMAVLKLENQVVEELCHTVGNVYPVNYNAKGQLVVAGAKADLDRLIPLVKQSGGACIPLAVSGGFHSPYMDEAAKRFAEKSVGFTTQCPSKPVYANVDATPYADAPLAKLVQQINHPVLWQKLIENMVADGYDTFIEVGIGNTLQKLIAKIAPQVKTYVVNTMEDVEKLTQEAQHVATT